MDSMSASMSMDHSTMTMTSGGASPSASSEMSMSGMDMGGGMGPNACKISMLWNWYTVDACFLSRTWHVRSAGAFAGSCIGVILLVLALEFLRRSQREFDRYLHRSAPPASRAPAAPVNVGDGSSGEADLSKSGTLTARLLGPYRSVNTPRLKLWQQVIRSGLYMFQFAVGYFIMLLAMYYNGYIIICIFIGAFLGAMIFQWDTYSKPSSAETRDSCCL